LEQADNQLREREGRTDTQMARARDTATD